MGGLTVGAIGRACQGVLGTGRRGRGTANMPPAQDVDPSCNCELPPNPFPQINPSNPSSGYSGISKFMAGLFRSEVCVEEELTNSITNPNSNTDPNKSIFKKFQILALLRRMYDLLSATVDQDKENRKAENKLNELAFA
ncbi:MAG: hypothetical protein HY094_02170 [Candidatus Melainabacteria bacterium]|nr:hypothetical protein [Candidatus Melainabacteria bacterium]